MSRIEQPDKKNENKNSNSLSILTLNKRSWHHSKAGGAEINLEETLKRLAGKGHEIHLLTGYDEGRPRTDNDESVSIRRVGFDKEFSPPWDVVMSYLAISIQFYWYLYRYSPDVIYTVNSPLPWPVFTLRPRVSIFHHIAIDSFFDTHPFPQNLLGYFSQWVGVLRERNTPTISVSPSTTEELVSRGHDPATVCEVKNGLNLEKYNPGTENDVPQIVYVGGLERYKGADRIPEIHQIVQEKMNSPIRLDVAGRDGEVADEVRDYCRKTESAYFHGFVSEHKKISLLKSSWVYIAPSRVEGWGIAVMEANACGTPAVGSNVNGLRDSIKDGKTGLLTNGTDPNVFASSIVDLLNDDEFRGECSVAARSWAAEHSWEKTTIKLEKLFQEISTE